MDAMPPDQPASLLRRMTASHGGDAPTPARSKAPELERALGTGILRAGDAMDGLGLSISSRSVRRIAAAEAFADLDERALCLLCDPAGYDATVVTSSEAIAAGSSLVAFSPALTDALIEVQTIGRVDGAGRPPRRPTRIDAALAQPFARSLLEQLDILLPAGVEGPRPGPLRTGSFVAGPDSLGLILTAPHFLRIDLELGLGYGAREGRLSFVMPAEPPKIAEAGDPPDPEATWKADMDAAGRAAQVRIEALLPPLRLPLSQLMKMKPGDLLPLEPGALSQVELVGGSSGVTMAGRKRLPRGASLGARLGQLNGRRAVKISRLPGERDDAAKVTEDEEFGAAALPNSGPQSAAPASGHKSPQALAADEAVPDLPELPDLPKLPDLPDLPDLP